MKQCYNMGRSLATLANSVKQEVQKSDAAVYSGFQKFPLNVKLNECYTISLIPILLQNSGNKAPREDCTERDPVCEAGS